MSKLRKAPLSHLLASVLSFLLIFTMVPQTAFGKGFDPNTGYQELEKNFWEDEAPEVGFYINEVSKYVLDTVQAPGYYRDWPIVGLTRGMHAGYDYINYIPNQYFEGYLSKVEQYVAGKEGDLDDFNSTEWSRTTLGLSALGHDIRDVGGYDFVEKFSSSFDFFKSQGINGPLWALLALNTTEHELYEDFENADANTVGKMLDYVMSRELANGGWAYFGSVADVDMTGMAIQALAPYYKDPSLYESSDAVTSYEDFATAVERAIFTMKGAQAENGGFISYGRISLESTVQVVVALTSLGIDPFTERIELPYIGETISFVTGGQEVDGVWTNNMIDAMLTFWDENKGGFKLMTSGSLNAMSTEQGLYGLVAYDRFLKGENTLYDMSDMRNGQYKNMKAKAVQANYDLNGKVITEKYAPYGQFEVLAGENVAGKTFITWNTKADGTGTTYEPGSELIMPEHEITFYGQFENIDYTIDFDLNGGAFLVDDVPSAYTTDDHIVLPTSEQVELREHNFVGWYDNPQFEGEAISALLPGTIGDQVYYAKWEEVVAIDLEAVQKVVDMIDQLPTIEEVTLDVREEVEVARAAYELLSEEQRELVSNIDKLIALELAILELEKEESNGGKDEEIEQPGKPEQPENPDVDDSEDGSTGGKEETEKPGKPGEVGKPGKPGEAGKPGEPGETEKPKVEGSDKELEQSSKEEGTKLPKTATNMFNMLMIGFGLLAFGALLFVFGRRRIA